MRANRYAAAYYIAGYAVECALKACIAKRTKRHDFPDKKAATDSHTHDLFRLVGAAGLKDELDAARSSDEAFASNWIAVRDWSTEDRYDPDISSEEAFELYNAITRRRSGILTWLRHHW